MPAEQNTPNAPAAPRLHSPDVLRGLAACGVVLFHVYYVSGLAQGGAFGYLVSRFDFFVRLFFGLSAFAMCYAYQDKLETVSDIKRFFLKRYFRIAPLFYFALLATYLLHDWPIERFDLLLSLSFLFTFVPGKINSLVAGGWSIGIEWLFYLAFPMLYAFVRSTKSALVLWLLLGTLAVMSRKYFHGLEGNEALRVYGLLYALAHLHYFAVGFLAYHLYARHIRPHLAECAEARRARYQLAASLVAIAVLGSIVVYFQRYGDKVGEEQYLSVAILVLLVAASVGFSRGLDNALTRMLGKISYSTYLNQFAVLTLFENFGVYARFKQLLPPKTAMVSAGVLTLLAVIAVSMLTYRFIEAPGSQLWKYLPPGKRTPERP